jgi:hypothetical protein
MQEKPNQMKELGSGLYLGNDGKIYKLVQASREDLEGYIVLSQTKQASAPVQDRDSAAYTAESVRNIDKFRARRDEDIIGGRED